MNIDVDDYGRVTMGRAALKELIYAGGNLRDALASPSAFTEQVNELCRVWDKPDYMLSYPEQPTHSAEQEHARRQAEWMFPVEYRELDVRDYVNGLCQNEAQRSRIGYEMDLYERFELLPVLRLMIFLVDHWRANKIVIGVGRGSSVASYVLFKIGIHKIDSLRYNLDIKEFLKAA